MMGVWISVYLRLSAVNCSGIGRRARRAAAPRQNHSEMHGLL